MEVVIGAQSARGPQKMALRNTEPILVVKMSQGQQVVALQSHQVAQCSLYRLSTDAGHRKCFERLWRTVHIIQRTLKEGVLRHI